MSRADDDDRCGTTAPGLAMETGAVALETAHDLCASVEELCGEPTTMCPIFRVRLVPREG